MALSHAILVTLLDKPQTGYELGKRFDLTVGYFWRARHQQIYTELHKLAEKGFVEGTTVTQKDRPNRIVYAITEPGRASLLKWAGIYNARPSVKEELIVKLFALGEIPAGILLDQLRARREELTANLAQYKEVLDKHYSKPEALRGKALGRYLGLRAGITADEASLHWCDEADRMIRSASPTA